jgi:iron uptake system component EfeO
MALYGPARIPYERIEPVAESFADLDPAIDGRIDDAPSPEEFTGFHRIEQALWETGSLEGMTPVAEQLLADVVRLQDLVADESYQPAQLANGSAELLDEISASKITGEEERYSHIDLLDFQANLEGSRYAFDLLRPALVEVDPELEATLVERFDALQADLDAYRSGDGFVLYTELTEAQTRELAQAVAAVAEPMATVASVLLGS